MTGSERRRLFALAALAVGVAAVALGWLGGDRSREPREPSPRSPARLERPGGTATSSGARRLTDRVERRAASNPEREDRATRSTARSDLPYQELAAQRAAALRFLRALLRYELGDAPPTIADGIRANAEPNLARLILAEPPRLPPGSEPPPPGRVAGLEPDPAGRAGAGSVTATIERRGRASGLLLELRRRGARWLVSDLR